MVRSQFERLSRVHGNLFPLFETQNKESFVQGRMVRRETTEGTLNNSHVNLISFVMGQDINEMPILLPLVVFIAVARINGAFLGLTEEEVDRKILKNYFTCQWVTSDFNEEGDEKVPSAIHDVFNSQRNLDVINLSTGFILGKLFDDNGRIKMEEVSLGTFLNLLHLFLNFSPKEEQQLPQCRG